MRLLLTASASFALAACGLAGQDNDKDQSETPPVAEAATDYGYRTFDNENLADAMASIDGKVTTSAADPEKRPVMQAQVVLERRGFGPGVIDGKMGMSTQNALRGFQEAEGLEVTGDLDDATRRALSAWKDIPATRVVTIPEEWGEETYRDVPEEPAEQAELERLGYESLDERLAERFHTTVEVLKALNPGGQPAGKGGANGGEPTTVNGEPSVNARPPAATSTLDAGATRSVFRPGQQIRVPNVGADRIAPGSIEDRTWLRTLASLGVGSEQPDVERIVVSKNAGTLKAFDNAGKLVALFTVTTGSEHDPLPLGEWKVNGVAKNPPFAYDPTLFWDVPNDEEKQQLPPGPNGPVGVVWIDLSKEHYGIHGTPEPQAIGRTQSHGCVRLTNWDAARLAQMVGPGTQVLFES